MDAINVTVLGSGTSTGVPVIGCSCSVCTSDEPRNQRTRASVAIRSRSGGTTLVIDTSPEFRLQVLKAEITQLDAVLYTHTHADHCHGFDDLRAFYFSRKVPITCYVGKDHEADFRNRFAYAFSETGYHGAKPQISLTTVPDSPWRIGELKIEPIILPHGHVRTWGYKIGRFAYVTDFKGFTEDQVRAWRGELDTMIASGIHFGSHGTHNVIPETMELFQQLGVRRGILTHLAHEVDYLRDSHRLHPGVEFAYDGMTIDV